MPKCPRKIFVGRTLKGWNKKDTTPNYAGGLYDLVNFSVSISVQNDLGVLVSSVDLSINIAEADVQTLMDMQVFVEDMLLKENVELYQLLRDECRQCSLNNCKWFIKIDEEENVVDTDTIDPSIHCLEEEIPVDISLDNQDSVEHPKDDVSYINHLEENASGGYANKFVDMS